jgi:hypothetical protein
VINELSKYTHVRPVTLATPREEADAFVLEALSAFVSLYEAFDDCRTTILRAVEHQINGQALTVFTEEAIGELDILSTHTRVDDVQVEKVEVTKIDPKLLHYAIAGTPW